MKSVVNGAIREAKVAPEARSEADQGRPFPPSSSAPPASRA